MKEKDLKKDWNFQNSYVHLPELFYTRVHPAKVAKPKIVLWNQGLAQKLGLDFLGEDLHKTAEMLGGNILPTGADPIAQAYAGHQFGYFTMLGDGRALLLGEQKAPHGKHWDIALKGSGPTPFSRRGDGKASLRAMLREYLISEAMHALGIETSRSLAVVSTGEPVYRASIQQGAILTRVMSSHLRVGTFEFAAQYGSIEEVQALLNYAIEKHYPQLLKQKNQALGFLKMVLEKQVDLVVDWMRVGFIHGVMNTDNMHIGGETFDYGPCAFLNRYDPKTVFSSIDEQGRYAFGAQPGIVRWNLSVLANALLPLLEQEQRVIEVQALLDGYATLFSEKWYGMMGKKIGFSQVDANVKGLIHDLLRLMEEEGLDYTHTFLRLGNIPIPGLSPNSERFTQWKKRWEAQIGKARMHQAYEIMEKINPVYIPRNKQVELVLDSAEQGDLSPFYAFLEILQKPYEYRADWNQSQTVDDLYDAGYKTFCGT